MAVQEITRIVLKRNDLRIPYAYAHLACGHNGGVPIRPDTLRCKDCGHEYDSRPGCSTCPECDCRVATVVRHSDPHNADDQLVAVGDLVECERCDWHANALEALDKLDASTISHARYRNRGLGAYYTVYRREPKSPTGVVAEMTIEATPEAEAALTRLGIAALSPTEGL